MKKYIIIILIALICGLTCLNMYQCNRYNNEREQYEYAINNIKSLNNQLNDRCIALQLSVDQLSYFNDSTIQQLDSLRKELKIKDNKIKQLGRIQQKVYIYDTLVLQDTILQTNLSLDTCFGDQWYTICLSLQYPGCISVDNTMNLNTDCLLYVKRETVNPPCKTWIGRLFQKKHNVYTMQIVEHNPYAKITENKLIIIQQ